MPNPYWTSPETGRTYDTTSDDSHGRWLEATPADLAADAALGGGRRRRTRMGLISVDQIVSSWALALSLLPAMWIAAGRRGSHA